MNLLYIVSARTDSKQEKTYFMTTTTTTPTTPYPFYAQTTQEDIGNGPCPAADVLPTYMTISGGLCLAVVVLAIINLYHKKTHREEKNKGEGFIFLPIIAMFGIFIAGE